MNHGHHTAVAATGTAATTMNSNRDMNEADATTTTTSHNSTALATFCSYQPTALPNSVWDALKQQQQRDDQAIASHTSAACESNLLTSVVPPTPSDDTAVNMLPLVVQQDPPALSPLQLQGVLLAIQRHCRIYTATGYRAGFFLGDGAGIGKGRQMAAILRDSLARRRPRHVWISVSRELRHDALRDLRHVHCHNCPVLDGTVLLEKSMLGQEDKGVLFFTYPFLVSGKRLEQIITWCAGTHLLRSATSASARAKRRRLEQDFDGCIILDEAHKAKNLAQDTKTAQLVVQLQRRLPKARVVYGSATGVSDIAHLAYAERLGLWDVPPCEDAVVKDDVALTTSVRGGTPFCNFAAFSQAISSRGLASLEMLALELKQQGAFLARTLSWEGADFETLQIDLTADQRRVYDASVQWWNTCRHHLEVALKTIEADAKTGLVWRIFWSSHQRFFKELAICAKVPVVAQDALQQVHDHGRCVVIGLQSTGEAGMQSLFEDVHNDKNGKSKANLLEKEFPSLISTLQATLSNFVSNHFPTTVSPPEPPSLPKLSPAASLQEKQQHAQIKLEIARTAALPPPAPIPDLVRRKQELLDAIPLLNLPPNPLDDLIDRLGGVDQVAEMTGRVARMIRVDGAREAFSFVKRVTVPSGQPSGK